MLIVPYTERLRTDLKISGEEFKLEKLKKKQKMKEQEKVKKRQVFEPVWTFHQKPWAPL